MPREPDARRQQALRRYEQQYEQLKSQLQDLGFILQGSVTERWKQCGKPGCRCQHDPDSRHGPYYQLSWKDQGKTRSIHLNPEQVQLCRQWIENHRELNRILAQMREISLNAASLAEITKK